MNEIEELDNESDYYQHATLFYELLNMANDQPEKMFDYLDLPKFSKIKEVYDKQQDLIFIIYEHGEFIHFAKEQTIQLCIYAVKSSFSAIRFIKNKSIELITLSIINNPISLQYIDNELKTMELCNIAFFNDSNSNNTHFDENVILYIPTKYITFEMCKIVIKTAPHLYNLLPEQLKTIELKNYLLDHIKNGLKYIDNPSFEMCVYAINRNIQNLKYVNQTLDILKIYYKHKNILLYVNDIDMLINNNLFNNELIKEKINNCPICDELKKYYMYFKCNKHIICFDCSKKVEYCYYKCIDNNKSHNKNDSIYFDKINLSKLYLNENFK